MLHCAVQCACVLSGAVYTTTTLLMFPSTPKLWKLQWNELSSPDLRLLAARPKEGKIRISWYLPAAAMLCCLRGEKHRKVLLLQIIYFEDAKCVESCWDPCEEPSEPVPGDRSEDGRVQARAQPGGVRQEGDPRDSEEPHHPERLQPPHSGYPITRTHTSIIRALETNLREVLQSWRRPFLRLQSNFTSTYIGSRPFSILS